jgi:hypothetical protein
MKTVKKTIWLCLAISAILTSGPALALTPNDTYYGNQWYLKRIGADKAWNTVTDSRDIIIAVIDTGVMIDHPDLESNIWINPNEAAGSKVDADKNGYIDDTNGWDFVNNSADVGPKFKPGYTEDGINHGTVVAGILAAVGNNAAGVAGVTWNAKIMSLKALDDAGRADINSVVKAINYAVANGARIINLSFTGERTSPALEQAIKRASQAGVIIVAAGGNDLAGGEGQNLNKKPLYPVCDHGANRENLVVGVAATGPLDEKAFFSGFGSKCIDLTAPGVGIFSTAVYAPERGNGQQFNSYYDGYWSGTSFAVPMVSATLALMMQVNPSLRPEKLIELLLKNTDYNYNVNPEFVGQLGRGRLNVAAAVQAAQASLAEEGADILLFNDSATQGLVKRVTAKGVVKAKFNTFDKVDVNVASGDFLGDNKTEIAVAPAKGWSPEVRIYDANGKLLKSILVFEPAFYGGVSLAAGDINGDGVDELIVARASGGRSEVKILDKNFRTQKSWLAYAPNFYGGVNLAVGDVNGDRRPEIVTAPADNGGPQIRIFSAAGKLLGQFFAYDKTIRGGFKVAVADTYSSIAKEQFIAVAPGKNQAPYLRIFDQHGGLLELFSAYSLNFTGGINVAAADLDNDGEAEIIAGAGSGGGPHLLLFKRNGYLIKAFYTDDKTLTHGVGVAAFVK